MRQMKDSGVKWIGEIPSDWEIKALKAYIRLYSEKNHADMRLLSVTREKGVIVRDKESDDNYNFIPDDLSGYKIVRKGDFAINKMKSWQGSYGVSDFEGIVSPAYYVCKLDFPNKKFFSIAIRSKAYIPFFSQYSKGIRVDQWDLSPSALKSIPFFEPPLSEQRAIADYLDVKCGEVDALVSLQGQMIAELQAYKQAVITEAVTHGLNPNAKMKDSGVQWIGRVPEHWTIAKLKYCMLLVNGRAYSQEELLSEGKYRVLRVGNFFTNETWYFSDMELEDNKYCEKGDLLYAWSASFGPYIWDGDKTIYHYHIWKVLYGSHLKKKYTYYLLKAITNSKLKDTHGSTMTHITMGSMNESYISLPSLSEQQQIASYLDTKCADIDALIGLKQQKIEELKEYKKILIFECVTGKRDVAERRQCAKASRQAAGSPDGAE